MALEELPRVEAFGLVIRLLVRRLEAGPPRTPGEGRTRTIRLLLAHRRSFKIGDLGK